jgi:hypothetical protein
MSANATLVMQHLLQLSPAEVRGLPRAGSVGAWLDTRAHFTRAQLQKFAIIDCAMQTACRSQADRARLLVRI